MADEGREIKYDIDKLNECSELLISGYESIESGASYAKTGNRQGEYFYTGIDNNVLEIKDIKLDLEKLISNLNDVNLKILQTVSNADIDVIDEDRALSFGGFVSITVNDQKTQNFKDYQLCSAVVKMYDAQLAELEKVYHEKYNDRSLDFMESWKSDYEQGYIFCFNYLEEMLPIDYLNQYLKGTTGDKISQFTYKSLIAKYYNSEADALWVKGILREAYNFYCNKIGIEPVTDNEWKLKEWDMIHTFESIQNINEEISDFSEGIKLANEILTLKEAKRQMQIYGYSYILEFPETRDYADNDYAKYLNSDQIKYLDADEKRIYTYLMDNQESAKAYEYMSLLENTINERKGLANALDFIDKLAEEDDDFISDYFTSVGEGTINGLLNFGAGFINFFNPDGKISAREYEQMYIIELLNQSYDLESAKAQYGENSQMYQMYREASSKMERIKHRSALQWGYETGTSFGNMLPSMAVGWIPGVGQPLALSLMFISSTGNSVESAYQKGATGFKAYLYGGLMGLSEVGMEYLLGGIPFLSKSQGLNLRSILGEGFEEVVQTFIETGAGAAFFGEEINVENLANDSLKAFGQGVFMSACLNGGMTTINMGVAGTKVLTTSDIAYFMNQDASGNVNFDFERFGEYIYGTVQISNGNYQSGLDNLYKSGYLANMESSQLQNLLSHIDKHALDNILANASTDLQNIILGKVSTEPIVVDNSSLSKIDATSPVEEIIADEATVEEVAVSEESTQESIDRKIGEVLSNSDSISVDTGIENLESVEIIADVDQQKMFQDNIKHMADELLAKCVLPTGYNDVKNLVKEINDYAMSVANEGLATSLEVKQNIMDSIMKNSKINGGIALFSGLLTDTEFVVSMIGNPKLNTLLQLKLTENSALSKNFATTYLFPYINKLNTVQFNQLFDQDVMKNYLKSLSSANLGYLAKNFSVNGNCLWLENQSFIDTISSFSTKDFYAFIKSTGNLSSTLYKHIKAGNTVGYANFLDIVTSKFYTYDIIKENLNYKGLIENVLSRLSRDFKDNYNLIDRVNESVQNDIRKALIDSSTDVYLKDNKLVVDTKPNAKYVIKYLLNDVVETRNFASAGEVTNLEQILILNSGERGQAALQGNFKILEVVENKFLVDKEAGLQIGLNRVSALVDGKSETMIVNSKDGTFDFGERFKGAQNFEVVSIENVNSYNESVASEGIYKINFNFNGVMNEKTICAIKDASTGQYVLDIDNLFTTLNIHGATDIKVSEGTIADVKEQITMDNYSASKDIFRDDYYGGNQSSTRILIEKMNKGIALNGVEQAKVRDIQSIIEKTYPDANNTEILKIVESYETSGCCYLAIANALCTYMGSVENGNQIFKNEFGYDLYYVDNNGQKSYNVETVALDICLERYKNMNLNELTNGGLQGITAIDFDSVVNNYFASKKVKVTAGVDTKLEDKAKFLNTSTLQGNSSFKIIMASNFDLVYLKGQNSSSSNDGALASAKVSGSKTENIGSHAMLVTDIDGDNNVLVSSWSKQYIFDFESLSKYKGSFANLGTLNFSLEE